MGRESATSPQRLDGTAIFDLGLARFATRRMSMDELIDPLHVTNAPEIIAAYRRAMEQGDRFPPVSVVRLCGVCFVADGHKRFSACRALGVRELVVEVWPVRRWLRDLGEQTAANARRWWRALAHNDPHAPRIAELLRGEISHLIRIVTSMATLRSVRRR